MFARRFLLAAVLAVAALPAMAADKVHHLALQISDDTPEKMTAVLNGKQYSEGNVKQMDWTFAQLLERASYGVTLYPGDVIGSGTVGTGCFLELNGSKITDNLWLKPGDEMVLEVEGLGRLENKIVLVGD